MEILLKLAEEFEEKTQYIKNISPFLEELKETFPNIKLHSFSEFKSFLDKYISTLIRKYLVRTKSVKNCSGISPDFAEFAGKHGFAVLVEKISGHVRNIFLGTDGIYLIDLSYIQFTCGYKGYGDDNILVKTLKDIYHNPYKAVKIEKLPITYFGNFSSPKGKYDNTNNPIEDIDFYHKDIAGQDEDFQELENWDKSLKRKIK